MERQIFSDDIKNGNTDVNDSYAKETSFLDEIERIDINPLNEIPKPLIRLYGFSGIYDSIYFDTEDELFEYMNNHNITYGAICILDYLGNVANQENVIRKTYDDGYFVLYSQIKEDKYAIYNYERSVCCNKFIWNYVNGNLNDEYDVLMKYSDNLSKTLIKKING